MANLHQIAEDYNTFVDYIKYVDRCIHRDEVPMRFTHWLIMQDDSLELDLDDEDYFPEYENF